MSQQAIDNLGQRLIREVRDETISDWSMILDGKMKGERAEAIRQLVIGMDTSILEPVIPKVVDSVLHHLLRWLEEEEDFLLVRQIDSDQFENIADQSDGFPGELYTDEGWIVKFSRYKSK